MAEVRTSAWGEAHRPEPAFPPVRVYVWELPVRVSHWFIFLPVVVLSFTGYYLHNPFIVVRGSAAFTMATIRFTHEVAGFIFIGAFLLRIYWFFMGNSWSNWRAFVPTKRRQWRGMGSMVAYYSFLRKDLAHHVGHNALAAVTYLAIFTFMLIEIITGLTLYTTVRGKWLLGWLFSWIPGVVDIQHIRLVHFCIMFAFFAFVIHHVYSAVLVSWEERNGLIESIFTGYKFVPKDELEEDSVSRKAD
ncbi:MAG TPA: Ni/Fe-hydrogenase, b-type cytochrome subunit [Terriglobales bacterium]|nr:Ni/Fe-hydrogenase, b-type cytochrome subunit [Terriglobales bacterium]